jgi:hypothetical protein
VFGLLVALILAVEIVALVVLRIVAPDVPVATLAPVVPLTLLVALLARRWFGSAAFRMRRLTPEAITGSKSRRPAADSPEELSRSIVERATEIRRTLLAGSPSEIRIEMCTLGYRACVNDMITLTHLANQELSNTNFLRRFKLRRARKKATDALAEAKEALPPGALRATRQEHQ